MVEFDLESDFRFKASLESLGVDGELDVLIAIDEILEKRLGWDDFVRLHGWDRVPLFGQETYPGAIELFIFAIVGESGQYYQVVATTVNNTVVICAVARRITPLP